MSTSPARTARTARRHIRRAERAIVPATHLSGRSIVLLFSEIDHLTDGRELIDKAQKISAQGATPIIVGPLGELASHLEAAHAVTLDLPLQRRGWLADRAIRRALANLVARSGVDLVHGIGPRAAQIGARLAEEIGVPFATTLAHPLSDHFEREAEAVIAAQRIFIANPEFTEEFLDMAPHVEERAQIATQGVDLDLFCPSAVRSAEIIEFVERLNIPHHKPVLLVKISENGGRVQSLLFEALSDLAPLEFFPIFELPHNAPKLRDRIERELAKRHLSHDVRLIEALADPRPLIQVADAMVVDAFRPLAFNRDLAEAGAFGKPVLAPLEEGVKAQVQHDVNGWIFTTQSYQTLKAAVAKALTLQPDKRRAMQAAAQLHVRTHYNAGATSDAVLAAYEALLAAAQPFPGVADMVDFDGDPLEIATPDAGSLSLIAEERQRRQGLTLRKGHLRDSSPAIRTALRAMAQDETVKSPAARLADRLAEGEAAAEAGRTETVTSPLPTARPKARPAPQPTPQPPLTQPVLQPVLQAKVQQPMPQNVPQNMPQHIPQHRSASLHAPQQAPQHAAKPPLARPEPPAQPTFAKAAPAPEPAVPTDVLPVPRTGFSLLELAQKPGAPLIARSQAAEQSDAPAVNVNTTLSLLKGQKP